MPIQGNFTLADLPDEVLALIMEKVIYKKDLRSLIATNKRVLCAALQGFKAGPRLRARQHGLYQQKLSSYSQQLQGFGIQACSLTVGGKHCRNGWEDTDGLLQSLAPFTWLARLVLISVQVATISNLMHLKELIIGECRKLVSVCNLPQLKQLFMHNCYDITTISTLPELQQVTMYKCCSITTISSLSALSSLHVVDCSQLASITDLPRLQHLLLNQPITGYRVNPYDLHYYSMHGSTLSNLPMLQVLQATNLGELKEISCLPNLQQLCLTSCEMLTSVGNLPTLQQLTVSGCAALQDISDVPALTKLRVKATTARLLCEPNLKPPVELSAGLLTSMQRLVGLKDMQLESCSAFISLEHFQGLQQLALKHCIGIKSVNNLPNLLRLSLVECDGLDSVMNLPALQTLQVDKPLHTLTGVPALRTLHYRGLIDTTPDGTMTSVPGNGHTVKLQQLCLISCAAPFLSNHPDLTYLNVSCCDHLTDISTLPALERLDVKWCKSLTALYGLPGLHTLNVSSCHKLPSISNLPQLLTLTVSYCEQFHGLGNLPHLRELVLKGCGLGLHTIRDLPSLQALHLDDCKAISSICNLPIVKLHVKSCGALTAVHSLPLLQSLQIESCKQLSSISSLPELQKLWAEECEGLKNLSSLPRVREVLVVGAHHAFHVQRVRDYSSSEAPYLSSRKQLVGLAGMPSLKILECCDPPPSINTLTALTELRLVNTPSLTHIAGLPMLRRLIVIKCDQAVSFDGSLSGNDGCTLPALMHLELLHCPKLPSIANFPALESILLFECPFVKNFLNLPKLKDVHFKVCGRVPQIRHRLRGMSDVQVTFDLLGDIRDGDMGME